MVGDASMFPCLVCPQCASALVDPGAVGAGMACIYLNGTAFCQALCNFTVCGHKDRVCRTAAYANAKTHHGHPTGGA